jgi:hypothetical protein
MRGDDMAQQPGQFSGLGRDGAASLYPRLCGEGSAVRVARCGIAVRALRLLCVLGIGTMLAACGRCGDFLPSSQGQIGACHSDAPPQQ